MKTAFQPLVPPAPEPAAPRPGRAMTMVVAAGLAALAASAVAGRYFWAGPDARATVAYPSLIPHDQAPQVRLWSPDDPAPGPRADSAVPELPLARLPGHSPLPRVSERYTGVRALPPAPPEPVTAQAAAPTPPGADADMPVVLASLPPLVPPRRPLPRAPMALGDQPEGEAPAEPGLARSLLPQPRPQRVTQVAATAAAHNPTPTPMQVSAQPAPPESATVLAAALDLQSAATGTADSCPATLSRAIPRRPSGAPGGQSAVTRLASGAGGGRDAAVAQAVIAGNLPDFLRQLVPVSVSGTGADGRPARITFCVMPDYLALGADSDFVRVPLGLPAASLIAERFDMVLPTTRMVDAIHAQASVRLRPSPMTPGAQMASTDYFLRHNATLEGQRRNAGAALGMLVSGHKKDLVLSNRLERNPGRVAIYGWHQANGQPIQPLSTVHGASYADYSHGIRLVSRTAFVNGQPVDLHDLLGSGRYARLISDEGPIATRLMLASLQ